MDYSTESVVKSFRNRLLDHVFTYLEYYKESTDSFSHALGSDSYEINRADCSVLFDYSIEKYTGVDLSSVSACKNPNFSLAVQLSGEIWLAGFLFSVALEEWLDPKKLEPRIDVQKQVSDYFTYITANLKNENYDDYEGFRALFLNFFEYVVTTQDEVVVNPLIPLKNTFSNFPFEELKTRLLIRLAHESADSDTVYSISEVESGGLPAISGIYKVYANNRLLYVGQSANVKTRLNSSHGHYLLFKLLDADKVVIDPTPVRDLISVEAELILSSNPLINNSTTDARVRMVKRHLAGLSY